jgi:lipid-binding SYLF domain-containing protein
MTRQTIWLLSLTCVLLLSGCAHLGNSPEQKRQSILQMKEQVLAELYQIKPSARAMINSAPGFAVFDNGNVNLFVVSLGAGYGVVRDNLRNRHIYMKMAEAGVGLGMGIKDFRAVIVFHTQDAMDRFINQGWQFGGHADAAAKAGNKGAAIGGEISVDNMTIFQLTQNGLALQAQMKGAKFWKDDELNH